MKILYTLVLIFIIKNTRVILLTTPDRVWFQSFRVNVSMVKLKVLCLHGYRQNESTFRERTGALRKLLKRNVEFFFISAPHVIPEEDNMKRPPEQQERGWFFSRPEKAYKGTDETDLCIGLEESIETVRQASVQLGPFDGVLAFSQGASLASMFGYYKDLPELQFQFMIFFSGFKSLLKPHSHVYANRFHCPSFHTLGASDSIIPPHMSRELAGTFEDPVTYDHEGGHFIPASPQLRTALQDFLRPFLAD